MVFVLGVSETGLGAMRLLGRRGIRCCAVDMGADRPAFSSRHCERRICVPDDVSADDLAAVLCDAARATGTRPVLLPTTDRFVRLASAARTTLARSFDLALPPPGVVEDLLDKRRFAARAAREGLRIPRTAAVPDLARLEQVVRDVGYPAVVKPRWCGVRGPRLPKAVVLRDDAATRLFRERHPHAGPGDLVVQEYIPGDDLRHVSVAVALDPSARPVASFVSRKVRQGNHGAGVGTFVETFRDDEAEATARWFLRRIGYVGVAEVELKRDEQTGELAAIEVNPRLWSQVTLPAALGLDFAWLAYLVARGAAPSAEGILQPRPGTWQDFWGDSYWTFSPRGYFWRGDVSASTWLSQTLTSRAHPFFEWSDPLPALVQILQDAAKAVKRAATRHTDEHHTRRQAVLVSDPREPAGDPRGARGVESHRGAELRRAPVPDGRVVPPVA